MQVSFPLWNLISFINMNAYHQKKSENAYELKIRGQSTSGTADDLRKRLTKCMRDNTPVDEAALSELDVGAELDTCEGALEELTGSIAEYSGDHSDTEGQRLQARTWHYVLRAGRIPVDESDEGEVSRCDRLVRRFNDLAAGIDQTKKRVMSMPGPSTLAAPPTVISAASTPVLSPGTSGDPSNRTHSYARPVPVYKWGLQFDGQSQSVGAFLQRVEELRRARGVTTTELFESAVDLFTGSALTWYRSTIGRISSWEQLCADMELVFQHPDHDIYLQQEIFNRVQAEAEPVDLFIAAMEGLYSRLSINVPEEVKLKQMLHNLNPQLQDRLALFEVGSVEQLRVMGRKAEAGRLRTLATRGATNNLAFLEPDLAYTPPRRTSNTGNARTPVERRVFHTKDTPDITCFRCHETGHISRNCDKAGGTPPSRIVCWRCNKAGHMQRNCRARLNPSGPRSGNEAGASGSADTTPRN